MREYHYYCLGSNYSPFADDKLSARIRRHGFHSSSLLRADLLFVRNTSRAKKTAALFPSKRVVVWTHEPSYDNCSLPKLITHFGQNITVFNVYTKNVFWHNLHFLSSYHYDDSNDLGVERGNYLNESTLPSYEEWKKRKLCSAIFAKKDGELRNRGVGNIPIDLNCYRQELARLGRSRDLCDLYGSNWGGLAQEESGFCGADERLPWWERKLQLLAAYRFNLALENTNWPYYVTEKIWQSIKAGCLPVYWGQGNSIYETFEKGSFVDASLFPSKDSLWAYLSAMDFREWSERMALCVKCFNAAMCALQESGYRHFDEVIERVSSEL